MLLGRTRVYRNDRIIWRIQWAHFSWVLSQRPGSSESPLLSSPNSVWHVTLLCPLPSIPHEVVLWDYALPCSFSDPYFFSQESPALSPITVMSESCLPQNWFLVYHSEALRDTWPSITFYSDHFGQFTFLRFCRLIVYHYVFLVIYHMHALFVN